MCLILPYMCPHTTICVSSYYCICDLILVYMCPHTTAYASLQRATFGLSVLRSSKSPQYMCLILLYMSSYYYMCPHTTAYVSSY